MPESFPTLYIAGCHRSGTTLLRNVLREHPSVYGPPYEATYLREFLARYPANIPSVEEALEYLCSRDNFPIEVHPRETLEEHVAQSDLTASGFLMRVFKAMMSGRTESHLLLKETSSGVILPALDRMFERLVVVDLVRDPRAVIHSAQKTWPGRSNRR